MQLVTKQCQARACPQVKLLFTEAAIKRAVPQREFSHYAFPCNMEIITKQCF